MCDFDNQRKCRGHAGYPRISSNKINQIKLDSFTRLLILLGPGASYFDYGFSDRLDDC